MAKEIQITQGVRLSLARTYLAKERTLLAYVRTGLTFIGVSLFIFRFIDIDFVYRGLASLIFAIPGAYAVIFGMYKILGHRNGRKELEQSYMVNGNGKHN